MHLLAAQPGGFNEDEGIIDLQQTPADLIFLSAADSLLAALADAADHLKQIDYSIRLANWSLLTKPAAFDLYTEKVINPSKVVIISLLGGKNYFSYGIEQLELWAEKEGNHLVVISGDDQFDPELNQYGNVPNETSFLIWRFIREAGVENLKNLLYFFAEYFFHQKTYPWHEPKPIPKIFVYDPDIGTASLQTWANKWIKCQPVMAIFLYRSHVQNGNLSMFNNLIRLLIKNQINPLPIAFTTLKDAQCLNIVNDLLDACNPQLILNTTSFSLHKSDTQDSLTAEWMPAIHHSVPNFQLILSSYSKSDWDENMAGLRPKDIAMYIALPELDGRIITRALSFKSYSHRIEKCQLDVVLYELHEERAQFITELALNWSTLSRKNNSQKKVGCILANYPTQDGRIGNGVGLDVPASTVNILNSLLDAGYTIEDLPNHGDELIRRLQASVTNNLEQMDLKHCLQSIPIPEYLKYFYQIPEANQTAVINRWGYPEQDPKCRQGALMISGLRLGHVFVGIQPSRGFNIDLNANYHDPDLVPPHSYLAFYFWLRHVFRADAVIHVGKHGNLEWLPGKGTGLSQNCWPDIALGPLPHFYPFIVNDPGEGSQAKRRTQGVIIDHLMPPLTRSDVYGDLEKLESLVDELYQASLMDDQRTEYLKKSIFAALKKSHVLEEITPSGSINMGSNSEEEILESLDAYLCDIKESQIRQGLHILGSLHENEKLADTLVALVRLPRGQKPEERGILHALCLDLNISLVDFNPLDPKPKPWCQHRPKALEKILEDKLWRNEIDTRERLELLSNQIILELIVKNDVNKDHNSPYQIFNSNQYPALKAILEFIQLELFPLLKRSCINELDALIQGLSGQFVPPGPSGAPTRGRLDTLPTGRNFYSLDNRSIPTKTAWELGKKSALALVHRHLQDHGDYPKQLGLSVWGTSTMRTGGDDIAQAFALMGIKPIWAPGSQRVIDFEITPAFTLNHPRVDVTLRVSGFFRDAFPNVMSLFDAAVKKLSEFEEPGNTNTIKLNCENAYHRLVSQGYSESEAIKTSKFRVFGSKPGAYGAGLQGLIDERCWESGDDLAEAYINWSGYAYGQNMDGISAHESFKDRLSQLDVIVQNQDNREHDILDSDDYYQFQGGMSNAARSLSHQMPTIYHNDHSNPALPKVRTLKEELNKVIRSRLTNPKWIKGIQHHGYKGAFEMSASVDYLFAYDATTGLVDDYQYESVCEALILDEDNQQFMLDKNPYALKEMSERLLEAIQRDMWEASDYYRQSIEDLLLQLDDQQERQSTE